jgi:hypothetical protein
LSLTAVGSNPGRDFGFFHVRKLQGCSGCISLNIFYLKKFAQTKVIYSNDITQKNAEKGSSPKNIKCL